MIKRVGSSPGLWLPLLLLLVVSCGSQSNGGTLAATAVRPELAPEESTAIGSPTSGAVVEISPDESGFSMSSFASMLDELDSYKLSWQLSFEGQDAQGEPSQWRVESQTVSIADPPARKFDLKAQGLPPSFEPMEMSVVQFGNEKYLYMPEVGCVALTDGDGSDDVTGLADPDTFLAGLSDATWQESGETINGEISHRYRFDERALPKLRDQPLSVEGQIYVASSGEFVTQVSLTASGQGDFLSSGQPQQGTMKLELNLSDVNQPLIVEPPTVCLGVTLYPMLGDAHQITSLDQLVSYMTSHPVGEVAAFYQAEMPLAGWTEAEEAIVLDNMALLSYAREGTTVIVDIETKPDEQGVKVLISP